MLPKVAASVLAEYCDVFCERGVFSLEQSKKILAAARTHGLRCKVHADEMSLLGGAELAADVGAGSGEHLLFSSVGGVKGMLRWEVGKKADAIVSDVPNPSFLGYRFGVNMVDKGVKNGRIAVDNESSPSQIVHLDDYDSERG